MHRGDGEERCDGRYEQANSENNRRWASESRRLPCVVKPDGTSKRA
jgi:hypothetical protein